LVAGEHTQPSPLLVLLSCLLFAQGSGLSGITGETPKGDRVNWYGTFWPPGQKIYCAVEVALWKSMSKPAEWRLVTKGQVPPHMPIVAPPLPRAAPAKGQKRKGRASKLRATKASASSSANSASVAKLTGEENDDADDDDDDDDCNDHDYVEPGFGCSWGSQQFLPDDMDLGLGVEGPD